MNVEELRELAETLVADTEATGVLGGVEILRDAVATQVGNPTDPEAQTRVAGARATLTDALRAGAADEFNARWRELVDEMGIGVLLPGRLLGRLDELFLQNQVTPQVIADGLQEISDEITSAVTNLSQLVASLGFLRLDSAALAAGEFEAAVIIPRSTVDNSLAGLGREFQDLEALIRPFVEAAGQSPPPIEVRQVASSDFLVAVALIPDAALLISMAVDEVLAVYDKVRRFRKLRQELSEAGAQADTLAAVENDATRVMEDALADIVSDVMNAARELPSDGREFEIKAALTKSVRGIAKRTDLGFQVSVRTGPPPEAEADSDADDVDGGGDGSTERLLEVRQQVIDNQRRAEYFQLEGEPVLQELGEASRADDSGEVGDP